MTKEQPQPQPVEKEPGTQMDDNIDDLGRKPDGTTLDQPTNGTKSENPEEKLPAGDRPAP